MRNSSAVWRMKRGVAWYCGTMMVAHLLALTGQHVYHCEVCIEQGEH